MWTITKTIVALEITAHTMYMGKLSDYYLISRHKSVRLIEYQQDKCAKHVCSRLE